MKLKFKDLDPNDVFYDVYFGKCRKLYSVLKDASGHEFNALTYEDARLLNLRNDAEVIKSPTLQDCIEAVMTLRLSCEEHCCEDCIFAQEIKCQLRNCDPCNWKVEDMTNGI